MKRVMRLAALLLALLLLCACGDTAPQEEGEEQIIPTVEGMTGLTLYDGTVTLRFVRRQDDGWAWQDDTAFPLDQTAVAELIALPEMIAEADTVADSDDLSLYGLTDPQKSITVTTDGEETVIYIGAQATDGRWYALLPDGTVCLAPEEVGTLLSRGIYSLATLPAIPALTAENILTMTLTDGEDASFTVVTDENGARKVHVRDVTEATAPLVEELGTLALTSCVDYDPAEGAWAVCGLDEPVAALRVTYLNDVGMEAEFSLTVGGDTGDGGRFVTVNDDSTIYRVEAERLTALLALAEKGL